MDCLSLKFLSGYRFGVKIESQFLVSCFLTFELVYKNYEEPSVCNGCSAFGLRSADVFESMKGVLICSKFCRIKGL